jgi:Ca2+-binding RTX toxin-like protein
MTSVASDLERYMLDLINADRSAAGLAPLTLELNLNSSAEVHSQWMTDTDTFDHEGAGDSTATERMRAAGMDLSGTWQTAENIGAVTISGGSSLYDEVAQLHANLMNSPGHRANLMDPGLTVIGIGIVTGRLTYGDQGTYNSVLVTQNFAATGGRVDLDLAGGGAAEALTGQGGDDHITGGGGNDTLTGGGGNDTVEGGAGNDLIRIGAGVSQVAGGPGTDTLDLPGVTRGQVGVTETAQGLSLSGGGVTLEVTGIEILKFADQSVAVADLFGAGGGGGGGAGGTAGPDLLQGDGLGPDSLTGLAGDDVLLGDGRGLYGTGVSAQVYRLYAAVFGREPDVGGHQAWVGLIASEARTLSQAVTGFVGSPEFQRTYGALSDTEFVTLLYGNVLGRAPDAAGLDGWLDRMDQGMARETVVLLFAESPEHRGVTAAAQAAFDLARDPTDWVDDVYRLYVAVLDRAPDVGGLTTWVGQLAGGMAFSDVVAAFMASPEFQRTYGALSDADFVTLLYNNVLDRAPDPGGFTAWVTALGAGMTRETVVGRFVQSPEFIAGTAADLRAYMQARGPDDVLTPGPGDDLLSGGLWADTFVFGPQDDGTKQVSDLEPWDRVDLSGFGYGDAAEALGHVTMQGADAVFADQGVTVVFLGAELDAGILVL